ncbi:FecR family protein [Arcticibacter eurypsychrophilus]|uniref:FecR family protein n=1 Tax=Arcticibacter eurypsychrophilus TaxID=1434752 RepID=UPI00084D19CC|nr:FecR domain-containing protein [Arcticibacter eurypsychrophilus]
MLSSNFRLTYLFRSYYRKTATRQEIEELFHLLQVSTDDEVLSLMHKEWDHLQVEEPLFKPHKSREILNQILLNEAEGGDLGGEIALDNEKRKWAFMRKWALSPKRLSAAAAILLFVSLGLHFLKIQPERLKLGVQKHQPALKNILSKKNQAILTLASGKVIILDTAGIGTLIKTKDFRFRKTKERQLEYLSLTNIILTDDEHSTLDGRHSRLNTISTPKGGQYEVLLPDGTKVWLNAASSLLFPAAFAGKTREVELIGEAYFEVAKSAKMPFVVKSRLAKVEVLGTHFNISAYGEGSAMKTTLLEGAVKISDTNTSTVLKPGEQAIVNKNSDMKVVRMVDVESAVAWKNGLFQFNEADIKEVMQQAMHWYDLNVSYEGPIAGRHITGKISRNVQASEFLNMLKYTGVKFKIEGKNVVIMN